MLQNYGKIPNSPLVYVPKGLLDSISWKSYHQVNLPVHNGNMPASEKHALKGQMPWARSFLDLQPVPEPHAKVQLIPFLIAADYNSPTRKIKHGQIEFVRIVCPSTYN